MLKKFMEVAGLPRGPMLLRDLGVGRDANHPGSHGHKEVKIANILETYPWMKVILLGDAGQQDAAIYGRICKQFPDQVLTAYIRHADRMPKQSVVTAVAKAQDAGAPILLLPGTAAIEADAIRKGYIAETPAEDTVSPANAAENSRQVAVAS